MSEPKSTWSERLEEGRASARRTYESSVASLRYKARYVGANVVEFDSGAWVGVAMMLGAALAALQVGLVAAHLEGRLTWSWAATSVPSWIIYLCLELFFILYVVFAAAPETLKDATLEREAKSNKATSLFMVVIVAMLFAAHVMLVERLDASKQHTFFAIAGPLFAGAGATFFFGALGLYMNWPDEQIESPVYTSSDGAPYS